MNKNNLKNNSSEINDTKYSLEEIIKELDELKNIALNTFDKNGNPNLQAALRAIECKVKILSQSKNKANVNAKMQMGEVKIDGIQLKLDIGEDYLENTID